MGDLIDLANKVFDILIKDHSEDPASRALFLYTVTISQPWYVLGSTKKLSISATGISMNFTDSSIDELDSAWKEMIEKEQAAKANKFLNTVKNTNNFSPKDGDTFDFWKNDDPWKEIKL
jgi:hypothetical protein